MKPSEINGNKVIFNRVGAGTIKDYEGTIEWDDINTTPIEMTFDKKKYLPFHWMTAIRHRRKLM